MDQNFLIQTTQEITTEHMRIAINSRDSEPDADSFMCCQAYRNG